jgi:hypothetical protein
MLQAEAPYCSWFNVCWRFGVVGLEWYPCCSLKLSTACVGDSVWLGWSGIHVAG